MNTFRQGSEPVHECPEIVAMLSDYLDRDLPPETCSAIDAHLKSCSNCEDAAAGLRRTVALCRRFRDDDGPGPLSPDNRQELRSAFEKALSNMREPGTSGDNH